MSGDESTGYGSVPDGGPPPRAVEVGIVCDVRVNGDTRTLDQCSRGWLKDET